jgi:hypothetical protein
MNLLEAQIKVDRVVHSAKTLPQKMAAEKFRRLFREHVRRETAKLHPIRELLVMVGMTLLAFVGVVTVIAMVVNGIIK